MGRTPPTVLFVNKNISICHQPALNRNIMFYIQIFINIYKNNLNFGNDFR